MPGRSSRLAVLASALAATVLVAGCGGEGPTGTAGTPPPTSTGSAPTDQATGTLRVRVLTGSAGRGLAQAAADAANAACDACEAEKRTANGATRQARQVASAVTSRVDVIAVHPIDAATLAKQVREAGTGGTVVVSLGTPVPGARFHVGQDPERSGFRLARRLVQQAMDDRGGLLVAQAQGAATEQFDQGADSVLDTSTTLILSDQTGRDTSAARAARFVRTQLEQQGADRLDGLFASSALQARGASRALDAAGVAPGDVTLAAPGATVGTWRRMLTGRQDFTLFDPPATVGRALGGLLDSIARGESPAPYDGASPTTRVPARLVGGDDLAEAVRQSGTSLSQVCQGLAAECRQRGLR